MLLQAFYSVRSERHLMERIEFDLLFRWCRGIGHLRAGVGPLNLLEELDATDRCSSLHKSSCATGVVHT